MEHKWNKVTLAVAIGLPKWGLVDWEKSGRIPMPTIMCGRSRYYTDEEVEQVVASINNYNFWKGKPLVEVPL